MQNLFSKSEIDALKKIQGSPLVGTHLKRSHFEKNSNLLRFEEIELAFPDGSIAIEVNDNTDEIEMSVTYERLETTAFESGGGVFEKFIGQKLGWIWRSQNDRGYNDLILLSFDGPIPQLAMFGIASDIAVYSLKELGSKPNQTIDF